MRFRRIAILAFFVLCARPARALDYCYYSFFTRGDQSCPDPSRSVTPGGAFPSFSDAFSINPASIPTINTPYGVEIIGSSANVFASQSSTNLALIKGFQNLGAAISTNSDKTFYSQNVVQAFTSSSFDAQSVEEFLNSDRTQAAINLGSAVGLPIEAIKKFTVPQLGLGLRYNRNTRRWELQPGIALNGEHFTLGFSTSNQGETQYLGRSTQRSYSAGLKFGEFRFEYTRLELSYNDLLFAGADSSTLTTQIFTASVRLKGILFNAGYRTFLNIEGARVASAMGAAQYQFARFLSLGYLYNYIPGSHSLGAQFLLN